MLLPNNHFEALPMSYLSSRFNAWTIHGPGWSQINLYCAVGPISWHRPCWILLPPMFHLFRHNKCSYLVTTHCLAHLSPSVNLTSCCHHCLWFPARLIAMVNKLSNVLSSPATIVMLSWVHSNQTLCSQHALKTVILSIYSVPFHTHKHPRGVWVNSHAHIPLGLTAAFDPKDHASGFFFLDHSWSLYTSYWLPFWISCWLFLYPW